MIRTAQLEAGRRIEIDNADVNMADARDREAFNLYMYALQAP
ncbi:hypothetical protein [Methylobacterium sp. 22177]